MLFTLTTLNNLQTGTGAAKNITLEQKRFFSRKNDV